jgi:hypothetical protein
MTEHTRSQQHRLFKMLSCATEVTESEVEELYNDLKFVFENPFDSLIEEAVHQRNCAYIELADPLPN